ncbi:MAG: hypothetical protein ACLGHQ_05375 [Acidimicrobiia bacterium]
MSPGERPLTCGRRHDRGLSMQCNAAVIHWPNQDWAIEQIEIDAL